MSLFDEPFKSRIVTPGFKAFFDFLKSCAAKDEKFLSTTRKIKDKAMQEAAYQYRQFPIGEFLTMVVDYAPNGIGINSLNHDKITQACLREFIFDPLAYHQHGLILVGERRLKTLLHLDLLESAILGKYYIFEHVRESVFQIDVCDNDGKLFSGTGFRCFNGTVMTNKHVLQSESTGQPFRIDRVYNDFQEVVFGKVQFVEDFDIAYITCDFTATCKKLMLDMAHVLDDIMVIGFPRVGSAQANPLAVSEGQVLGFFKSIHDGHDYAILDAKVSPGNSGGPVINRYGLVCGIIVQDVEHRYYGGVSSHSTMIPVQTFAPNVLVDQSNLVMQSVTQT